jgi:hypothetical protein
LGIESSSLRNGLPHESVLEIDVHTGSPPNATAPRRAPDCVRLQGDPGISCARQLGDESTIVDSSRDVGPRPRSRRSATDRGHLASRGRPCLRPVRRKGPARYGIGRAATVRPVVPVVGDRASVG